VIGHDLQELVKHGIWFEKNLETLKRAKEARHLLTTESEDDGW
jgi:hypothetical protein